MMRAANNIWNMRINAEAIMVIIAGRREIQLVIGAGVVIGGTVLFLVLTNIWCDAEKPEKQGESIRKMPDHKSSGDNRICSACECRCRMCGADLTTSVGPAGYSTSIVENKDGSIGMMITDSNNRQDNMQVPEEKTAIVRTGEILIHHRM